MAACWLPQHDSNVPSPVNSRPPSPRWLYGNEMVEQPGTAPGSAGLQDLRAAFCLPLIMVPRPGFEPGSPVFQTGAFTRLAFSA